MKFQKPLKFPILIQKNITERIKENKTTKLINGICKNCYKKSLNKSALFCKHCGYLFINKLKES
jgi:ribosomal protein L37E